MDQTEYYKTVGEYYNHDAIHFEKRYHHNPLLKRIRASFRDVTNQINADQILEIGYGPGLDLIHFAKENPQAAIYGIDISSGMYQAAIENAKQENCKNIFPEIGSVEDISRLFPGKKFDLIYVFFGALNTVEDLEKAASIIYEILKPNGKAVLTFVNKWYLRGVLVPLIKGRFRIAFARFKKIWGGYSPRHYLPSKCYSVQQILHAFKLLKVDRIKGYSILFPPWYDAPKWTNEKALNRLWNMDERLSEGVFRGTGEYALFVFHKPS